MFEIALDNLDLHSLPQPGTPGFEKMIAAAKKAQKLSLQKAVASSEQIVAGFDGPGATSFGVSPLAEAAAALADLKDFEQFTSNMTAADAKAWSFADVNQALAKMQEELQRQREEEQKFLGPPPPTMKFDPPPNDFFKFQLLHSAQPKFYSNYADLLPPFVDRQDATAAFARLDGTLDALENLTRSSIDRPDDPLRSRFRPKSPA